MSAYRLGGWLVAVSSLVSALAYGQLSPGELSGAHAGLEGLSNCTKCHAIGKAVAKENCLECHTELARRIQQHKGLHGSISGHDCVECHKEHHGRTFSIVKFDQKSFNHGKYTGFALEGKHTGAECASCHKAQFIRAADVRTNAVLMAGHTYLGLEPACNGCHADAHKGQFAAPCQSCHTAERWKPLPRFSHENTRYPLVGLHTTVPCTGCHRPSQNDPKVVRFKGIAFGRCVDCHADPHRGKLKGECTSCHSTAGWKKAESRFNHAATKFPLRGLHAGLRCDQCHTSSAEGGGVHALRFVRFESCVDCHRDPHRGQFVKDGTSTRCERCHSEEGWRVGPMKRFDHSTTHFPLIGRHRQVSCMECHGKEGKTHVVLISLAGVEKCASCHVDPHGGQFVRKGVQRDCKECHRESGFTPTRFGPEQHGATRFALDGAHGAVPCISCHERVPPGATTPQRFTRDAVPQCVDCHKDPHRGAMNTWTPACIACHTTATWKESRFRHDQTRFKLDGRHINVPCSSCHNMGSKPAPVESWKFRGIPLTCEGCHNASGSRASMNLMQGGKS
jgi:hypothetical protein